MTNTQKHGEAGVPFGNYRSDAALEKAHGVGEGENWGDRAHFSFIILVKDTAWQDVSMNIAEKKEAVKKEYFRLSRSGTVSAARFRPALVPAHYIPVPLGAHAGDPGHLRSAETMRKTILGVGFALLAWNDVTEGALRPGSRLLRRGDRLMRELLQQCCGPNRLCCQFNHPLDIPNPPFSLLIDS